jgi:uracil phosphoribosyltransferase
MPETAYLHPALAGGTLTHGYGPAVHLCADAWGLSMLARLGHPDTGTLDFHRLLRSCYRRLLHAVSAELPTITVDVPTRMVTAEPRARYRGAILDPAAPVVIVDVARAGMLPSLEFQQALLEVLDPGAVRVDHLYMQRVTGEDGHVAGVDLSGSKIGGPVDGATILVPDPMGATGGSISRVIEHYRSELGGAPRRIVACHLMVTPEYLRHMARVAPDVAIYAMRIDRGLSDDEVLASTLGALPGRERGLTDNDYIVPGAGGLGELVNNAFV